VLQEARQRRAGELGLAAGQRHQRMGRTVPLARARDSVSTNAASSGAGVPGAQDANSSTA
jgi:hypothetical protein